MVWENLIIQICTRNLFVTSLKKNKQEYRLQKYWQENGKCKSFLSIKLRRKMLTSFNQIVLQNNGAAPNRSYKYTRKTFS